MMRMENSPEYEAKMTAYAKKREREQAKAERKFRAIVKDGKGKNWTRMEHCPFEALAERYGNDAVILVSDGERVTVARIRARFGTPIFFKKQPEAVYRDGMMRMEGGEIDPRPDLPKW